MSLEFKDLYLGYGNSLVVQGVSMSLNNGDRICLLGGNGSGKSTLIKGLFGLVELRKGSIKFQNNEIGKLKAHERFHLGIAYVPQNRKLFANKSVLENLQLACLSSGMSKEIIQKRQQRVISSLPRLSEKLNSQCGLLSGGEQQMVAIGRALMCEPKVLLLDEPSAGLAPVWIDILYDVIESTIKEYKYSMLLVEQNVQVGLDLTNTANILANGIFVKTEKSLKLINDKDLIKTYLG